MKRSVLLTACGVLAVAAACATASADAVRLKSGLEYSPVTIVSVANGFLTYRLNGRNVTKPLGDVASVTVNDNAEFNRGEALLSEKKYAQAVAAFTAADKAAAKPWQKRLAGYRILAAADAAGDIEESTKRWIQIVKADGASPASLKLHPTKAAAAKSKANDNAIRLLEAQVPLTKDKAFIREMKTLLAELYTQQGQMAKARKITAELSGSGVKPPNGGDNGNGGKTVVVPPPSSGRGGAALRLAGVAMKSGNYAQVIRQIEPALKSFSEVELPPALYLLGAAQLELGRAEKAPVKRKGLLSQAGLNLMRVVVFAGDADEAAPALLAAGEVNQLLGDTSGAGAAYMLLRSKYPKSPLVGEAGKRLAKLDKANGG